MKSCIFLNFKFFRGLLRGHEKSKSKIKSNYFLVFIKIRYFYFFFDPFYFFWLLTNNLLINNQSCNLYFILNQDNLKSEYFIIFGNCIIMPILILRFMHLTVCLNVRSLLGPKLYTMAQYSYRFFKGLLTN